MAAGIKAGPLAQQVPSRIVSRRNSVPRVMSAIGEATPPPETVPEVKHVGEGHYVLDQDDERVKYIARHMPYYSAEYAPHDVPAFYDVTGITEDPKAFQTVIDLLVARYRSAGDGGPTHIAGFDARGFIFGPPLALALGVPFVLIRKAGKLPGVVTARSFQTEYSSDETVMRIGSVRRGDKVVLVDDLIATGGTALAGFDLVDALGASVYEFTAIIDLPHLNGVRNIHSHRDGYYKDVPCFTVLQSSSIDSGMCNDPPRSTPRIVPASEAESYMDEIPSLTERDGSRFRDGY